MPPVIPASKIRLGHAIGSGAVALALLFASCTATPPPPSNNGGEGGSDMEGGAGGSGTGGSSGKGGAGGTAGRGGAGGSGTGGSSGAGGSGTGGSSGAGGSGTGGSSGAGGSSGSGGAGGSAPADAAAPADTAAPVSSTPMPTCTMDAAGAPPALKKTPVVRIPNGDQAGQVIGVPGEKGIYIIGHRTGKLYYAVDGKLDPTPMASVAIKNNAGQDEQGMLGVALHPKFAQNQLFYLFYTAPNANIRIDELKRTGMTSSMMVRTIWDKARVGGGAFHNGGQIAFNPKDGDKILMYHAVGNTASVGESGKAEGTAGRVLIHDLSGATVTSTTMSFGLRNPYRMTIDRHTGDMYMGEIDDPPGGAIYVSPFASPVKDYGYRGGGVKGGITGKEGDRATIGGVVYRGMKIPGICGRYFFSSWPGGNIKSIATKDGKLVGTAAGHGGLGSGGIASFGEDGDGEIYYATQGGEVFRIEAN
jgi:hypothetical protein